MGLESGECVKVGVIGTGHVGLVTCVTMAAVGHEVVGTDNEAEKIDLLTAGRPWFFEPALEDLLKEQLSSGRLTFSTEPQQAIEDSQVLMISVGTPPRASGEANLVAVEKAVQTVARYATKECVIVEKSTVPTGTASRVRLTIDRMYPQNAADLHVASNPEFLREGHAVQDAMEPDRILVGVDSDFSRETLRTLYSPWTRTGVPLVETDIATAELAKHACNAFLALKISFINSVAEVCERADADVVKVAELMGMDARIGPHFLNAGMGYGGSCFPKDLMAFERLASQLGCDFGILHEIARANERALDRVFEKIGDILWNLEDKRIALLGLAFKPGTDDTRFAPALALAEKLIAVGSDVIGFDPVAAEIVRSDIPDLATTTNIYEALEGADCAVVCTEWDEVVGLDLRRAAEVMNQKVVVDGRNVFEGEKLREHGFSYFPTGRPRIVSE